MIAHPALGEKASQRRIAAVAENGLKVPTMINDTEPVPKLLPEKFFIATLIYQTFFIRSACRPSVYKYGMSRPPTCNQLTPFSHIAKVYDSRTDFPRRMGGMKASKAAKSSILSGEGRFSLI
jgi:hypothetical protein